MMQLHGISLSRTAFFHRFMAVGGVVFLVITLASVNGAAFDDKKDKRGDAEDSDVKNFGKVNDHIYRGGQPSNKEYTELAALGIKTVIDLRDEPEKYARRSAEGAGLRYINIQLNAKRPPTEAESDKFLQLVNDQRNWPVFVHCAGGRHRTGVLLAVYRMEMDGWDARRAYHEMKDFKFYSSYGYGDMKDFVFGYYDRMMTRRAAILNPLTKGNHSTAGQGN